MEKAKLVDLIGAFGLSFSEGGGAVHRVFFFDLKPCVKSSEFSGRDLE